MKILYLFNEEQNATATALVEGQQKEHEVTVVDLRSDADFEKIVKKIEEADRIISW